MIKVDSKQIATQMLEIATFDDRTKLALVRFVEGSYGITRNSQPLSDQHWPACEVEQCLNEFSRLVAEKKQSLAKPQDTIASKRILVVDDEPHVTEMIKFHLDRVTGYQVQVENDSARAMTTARKFRPNVILLDVMMPEPDGRELAAFLHEDKKLGEVPIIFVTALVSPNGSGGRDFGFDHRPYVGKPINFGELIGYIEQLSTA